MGVKHINKAFTLQLPSTEKLVLLGLARYANNDDDTCFPGIATLSTMTGFSEKTVIRAIRVLSNIEIIDVAKNPKGPNHIYTLYLTGDNKAWDLYLKSKENDIKVLKGKTSLSL